uniref:Uncharacterized protein n=1 Tax=Otolemur garnettii TaxID=30611 RepID=H0XU07_OTOGA
MLWPVRNVKVVDFSQFKSDDADEDYGRYLGPPDKKSSAPVASVAKVPATYMESGLGLQNNNDNSNEKYEKTKKDDCHSADNNEDENDHKNLKQSINKKNLKQRETLIEVVCSEDKQEKDAAPFQEKDSLMKDDSDSDYSSKKEKKMVKKSKPESKEKKMPEPRLKATVTPSPVRGKGQVGGPTASRAVKEKPPRQVMSNGKALQGKTLLQVPQWKVWGGGSEDEAYSGED